MAFRLNGNCAFFQQQLSVFDKLSHRERLIIFWIQLWLGILQNGLTFDSVSHDLATENLHFSRYPLIAFVDGGRATCAVRLE